MLLKNSSFDPLNPEKSFFVYDEPDAFEGRAFIGFCPSDLRVL
jgi:hypothetical protein